VCWIAKWTWRNSLRALWQASDPHEAAAADEAMNRAILTLWQTSLLRHGRPTVIDEVANGYPIRPYLPSGIASPLMAISKTSSPHSTRPE